MKKVIDQLSHAAIGLALLASTTAFANDNLYVKTVKHFGFYVVNIKVYSESSANPDDIVNLCTGDKQYFPISVTKDEQDEVQNFICNGESATVEFQTNENAKPTVVVKLPGKTLYAAVNVVNPRLTPKTSVGQKITGLFASIRAGNKSITKGMP